MSGTKETVRDSVPSAGRGRLPPEVCCTLRRSRWSTLLPEPVATTRPRDGDVKCSSGAGFATRCGPRGRTRESATRIASGSGASRERTPAARPYPAARGAELSVGVRESFRRRGVAGATARAATYRRRRLGHRSLIRDMARRSRAAAPGSPQPPRSAVAAVLEPAAGTCARAATVGQGE